MWRIKNQTSYAVERSWVRGRLGEEIWTVALKATFDIRPDGTTQLSSSQLPINTGPVLNSDNETLLYDTDFGPEKMATDIILNGHAWTPDGKPAPTIPVGLKIGNVTRIAQIYGDRIWDGKRYKEPLPFEKLPLHYTRMSQGKYLTSCKDNFNPVGVSVETSPEIGISVLPNIEFYDDETPGFGALPRYWPGRLQFADTYDKRWQREQAPLLPEDLDERYWQSTPPPLYAGGRLKGGETVYLGNLTPPGYGRDGLLVFELPRIVPAFRTQFYDGSVIRHQAKLHTIILETDFPRVSLVWHTALSCHHQVNQLESTTVSEKKRLFIRTKTLPTQFPEWEALL
ncbi:DUF2169 domain-containing protein [Salmonella bongori]|uniref:DUF2169 domain-containing protein n=1 Tax=Salmonella bongori TaxID=54736 RepID=A0A8F8FKX8_SALBN|nr:DUF2169 domain-containing protein [Salmonella bongori]QXY83047.1 DUF2169 domain-containing protein [Salmonella bongori]